MSVIHALMWSPVGVRTSTVLFATILFDVGLMVRGSLSHAVFAPLAWLLGFESAWAVTTHFIVPGSGPLGPIWWIGGAAAVVAYAAGVRVDWRWLTLTAALWALWVATGWHYNLITNPRVDWWAEALNESTKTAWGLAYLWPMLRRTQPLSTSKPLALDRSWVARSVARLRPARLPIDGRPTPQSNAPQAGLAASGVDRPRGANPRRAKLRRV